MRVNGIGNRPAAWSWPLWGVGAGILGAIGHLFTMETPGNEETTAGSAFIADLNHTV